MLGLPLFLLVSIHVARVASRDLPRAFCLGTAYMVLITNRVRLELPGALPEFTIQRSILLILFIYWMQSPFRSLPKPKFLPWLAVLAVIKLASTALSITPLASFKDYVGFLSEVLLFTIMLSTLLYQPGTGVRLMQYLVIALAGTAVIAFFEKYRAINFTSYFAPGFHYDWTGAKASFPHRILFGYAAALGCCLAVSLAAYLRTHPIITGWPRRIINLSIILLPAATYFGNSRGPWIAVAFGMLLLLVLGTTQIRRIGGYLALGVLLVVIVRPGVRDALVSRIEHTFNPSTSKGQSYDYRWILWDVAWSEIVDDPVRLAVGYGGKSTEVMDLAHYFPAGGGGSTSKIGFTSWDNQLACDLIESGILGFLTTLGFLATIILTTLRRVRDFRDETALRVGLLAAIAAYLVALISVGMFSVQLTILFWAVACLAVHPQALGTPPEEEEYPARA